MLIKMQQHLQHMPIKKMASLLAEVATLLISNGANSTRTKRNVMRIAEAYGYDVEIFFSFSGVVLSVHHNTEGHAETIVKTISAHGINFNLISEVSILSWDIVAEKPSYRVIEERLVYIKQQPAYSHWIKMLWIGVATAALSKIFSGTYIEFIIVFIASCIGFWTKLFLHRKHYNIFMLTLISAFISVSVVKFAVVLGLGESSAALSACVLWLIPGVPLINGFLDLLEGHIVSGWAKAALGTMLIFMIAVGYYLSIFIFKTVYGI